MAESILMSETEAVDAPAVAAARPPDGLLAAVRQALGGDLPGRAAGLVGADPARTETALDLLAAAILRRLARRGASAEGAAWLLEALADPGIDRDVLETMAQLGSETAAADSARPVAGEQAARALFGQWTESLVFQVGSTAGLRGDAVSALLGLATPLVYAALRDYARQRAFGAEALREALAGEFLVGAFARRRPLRRVVRSALRRAPQHLHTGLARAAGTLARVAATLTQRHRRVATRAALVLVALVAVAVLAWRFDGGQADASASAAPATALRAPASGAVRDPREAGMDGLRAFLASDASEVEFVMALDGVVFEPASATLRSQSNVLLAQLAAVLAAHPDAQVVIEAHAGATAQDPELAERRALAVRAALAALGIQPARMKHAGSKDAQRLDARVEARITRGPPAARS